MKQLLFIKRSWQKSEIGVVILIFFAWRIWITTFALLGIILFPLAGKNFFGGGLSQYLEHPLFWGWSNFDGEHYTSIAIAGYRSLQHSFFPFYPLVIHILSGGVKNLSLVTWVGVIFSNILAFLCFVVFWKLVRMDYSARIASTALVIFALFPTSFYLGSVYTSSIFLLLVLLCFYFIRKSQWWLAAMVGALATATRLQGLSLILASGIEWLVSTHYLRMVKFRRDVAIVIGICLMSAGFFAYLIFLYKTTGNFLSFYADLSPYGNQREVGRIILLPQVFWRYVKMLVSVSPYSSLFFVVVIEFLSGALGLFLLYIGWIKKVRLSYLVYALASYILPTLTGSFSSLPRYMMAIFPFFITLALMLEGKPKVVKGILFFASVTLLAIETMLFIRGYWVA